MCEAGLTSTFAANAQGAFVVMSASSARLGAALAVPLAALAAALAALVLERRKRQEALAAFQRGGLRVHIFGGTSTPFCSSFSWGGVRGSGEGGRGGGSCFQPSSG